MSVALAPRHQNIVVLPIKDEVVINSRGNRLFTVADILLPTSGQNKRYKIRWADGTTQTISMKNMTQKLTDGDWIVETSEP